MAFSKRALRIGLLFCGLLPLTACANTPWAGNLERSLAADPQLANPAVLGASPPAGSESSPATAQLPAGFPGEIPRYPNATLADVAPTTSQPIQTRWITPDSIAQVRQFYQERLQRDGWQIVQPSDTAAIAASRDNLRVAIDLPESTASPATTEFSLSYQFEDDTTAQPPAQPGDAAFIGPVPSLGSESGSPQNSPQSSPQSSPTSPSSATIASLTYSDLNQAPSELQQYVTDLANLGALPLRSTSNASNTSSSAFKPNQAITRREYARWLVVANNKIYANQPSRQIRLGTASDQSAFPDISANDPDFGAIQGLANAGLIASSLSGASSPITFRPDAPLTREEMMLWKVPVDLRRSLPSANLEAIQQTWGFQDAAKIDPKAQRAVIADYQNGDLANIRRAFGYTTLFQPKKTVSRAEAAAALWYFGSQGDGLSAKDALQVVQQNKPIGG